MEKISIYFITSYTKKMLSDYRIFINEKDQNYFANYNSRENKIFINNIIYQKIKQRKELFWWYKMIKKKKINIKLR